MKLIKILLILLGILILVIIVELFFYMNRIKQLDTSETRANKYAEYVQEKGNREVHILGKIASLVYEKEGRWNAVDVRIDKSKITLLLSPIDTPVLVGVVSDLKNMPTQRTLEGKTMQQVNGLIKIGELFKARLVFPVKSLNIPLIIDDESINTFPEYEIAYYKEHIRDLSVFLDAYRNNKPLQGDLGLVSEFYIKQK